MRFSILPKQFAQVPHFNWVRAAIGAFCGIATTGLVCRLWLGASVGDLPLLVAPLGASAVLAFALPASPLAEPWSVVGGNVMSALVGVAAAKLDSSRPQTSKAPNFLVWVIIAVLPCARRNERSVGRTE